MLVPQSAEVLDLPGTAGSLGVSTKLREVEVRSQVPTFSGLMACRPVSCFGTLSTWLDVHAGLSSAAVLPRVRCMGVGTPRETSYTPVACRKLGAVAGKLPALERVSRGGRAGLDAGPVR